MGYYGWKPYVPVAKRREQAHKAAAKAKKAGQDYQPVSVHGRSMAKTFWGKAWCDNLEAYSDFENRLPRGRTYVRNGSVIDLRIEPGKVLAQVVGSSLYRIEIAIATLPVAQWQALVANCTGSIASLVELLQGKLSKPVMERMCEPKTGLFPSPKEIQLHCSCPDWASMCKHVTAALYGVGVRLDEKPELLFTLRQVDAGDLVIQAALPVKTKQAPATRRVLDDAGLADVFGIELGSKVTEPAATTKKPRQRAGKAAAAPSAVAAKVPTTKSSPAAARKTAAKPKKAARSSKHQDTPAKGKSMRKSKDKNPPAKRE